MQPCFCMAGMGSSRCVWPSPCNVCSFSGAVAGGYCRSNATSCCPATCVPFQGPLRGLGLYRSTDGCSEVPVARWLRRCFSLRVRRWYAHSWSWGVHPYAALLGPPALSLCPCHARHPRPMALTLFRTFLVEFRRGVASFTLRTFLRSFFLGVAGFAFFAPRVMAAGSFGNLMLCNAVQ
jgi:hypothetical protein